METASSWCRCVESAPNLTASTPHLGGECKRWSRKKSSFGTCGLFHFARRPTVPSYAALELESWFGPTGFAVLFLAWIWVPIQLSHRRRKISEIRSAFYFAGVVGGAGSTVTTLATAGVNQLFRGVALAPDAAANPKFHGSVKNTNGFTITWTTLLNRNYSLQWTDNLLNTNWVTLTNLTVSTPIVSVTDTTAPADTNRFYRVILNP